MTGARNSFSEKQTDVVLDELKEKLIDEINRSVENEAMPDVIFRLRTSASRIYQLRKKETEKFTVDALLRYAQRLGLTVKIQMSPGGDLIAEIFDDGEV